MASGKELSPGPVELSDLSRVWHGRKVLLTGHTGFKGAWLAFWLHEMGAQITGLALDPYTEPALFSELKLNRLIRDLRCDIRDLSALEKQIRSAAPEVILHLAAQPIVLASYDQTPETFHTNTLGSVNVFECARRVDSVKVLIHVSTDKCYLPNQSGGPYREDDPLGGHDPYSASKAAAEVAFLSYLSSIFLPEGRVRAASVRAGNVIGGGDWAQHRILPDAVRALSRGEPVRVRNPDYTRPWQHVLDALSGYLLLASHLLAGEKDYTGAWNFGPADSDQHSVAELVEKFIQYWGEGQWVHAPDFSGQRETARLALDSTRARRILQWSPRWDFDQAVRRTARWYRAFYSGLSAAALCRTDIEDYMSGEST